MSSSRLLGIDTFVGEYYEHTLKIGHCGHLLHLLAFSSRMRYLMEQVGLGGFVAWMKRYPLVPLAAAGALAVVVVIVIVSADDPPAPPEPVTRSCQDELPSKVSLSGVPRVTKDGATFMYEVPSGGDSFSVPVEKGGAAEQIFVATGEGITDVAVVVGIDPSISNIDANHDLKYQIYAVGEERRDPIAEATATETPATNNKITLGAFDSEVKVRPGSLYLLRVTNISNEPVGIYVNFERAAAFRLPLAPLACIAKTKTSKLRPYDQTMLSATIRGPE